MHQPERTVPNVEIPSSSTTVTVRVIDSTTRLHLDGSLFWHGDVPHFDHVNSPVYCFLISHGDRHVIFDLAVRQDWENYAPKMVALIKLTTKVEVEKDVATILDEDSGQLGVTRRNIEAVILSHMHFDHVGDPTTFLPHTSLVVGPGYIEATSPGYPTRPDALTLESDTAGRKVREIDFTADKGVCRFGSFPAVDYFGDGSLYLLDAPGHSIGHMCAAARVSIKPDRFVFMGADACHHVGIIRPSQYLPLPKEIDLPTMKMPRCPGELIQSFHPHKSKTDPFFLPSSRMFPDMAAAMQTISAMQELDALGSVFIIIAHDHTLLRNIPLYPKAINEWNKLDMAVKTRWLFCEDFEQCIRSHEGEVKWE